MTFALQEWIHEYSKRPPIELALSAWLTAQRPVTMRRKNAAGTPGSIKNARTYRKIETQIKDSETSPTVRKA